MGKSKVTFESGSFFDSVPMAKDGDAFVMRYILHDWSDEDALKILKNVRKSFGNRKATLLIGECAVPERDGVAVVPTIHSVDMQMMLAFGQAKERTPSQWREVFAKVGFELKNIHPTRSLVHWIEAVPV